MALLQKGVLTMEMLRERSVETGIYYRLEFNWIIDGKEISGWGFMFICDKDGNAEEHASLTACRSGMVDGKPIGPGRVRAYPYRNVIPAIAKCDNCGNGALMSHHCGAWVCDECGNHIGLARCYCGWSASGNDGLQELQEMGETVDDVY
jgi:ribosomal protein L37AE/L43A